MVVRTALCLLMCWHSLSQLGFFFLIGERAAWHCTTLDV